MFVCFLKKKIKIKKNKIRIMIYATTCCLISELCHNRGARSLDSPWGCHSVCGSTQNRGPRAACTKAAIACVRAREGAASAHVFSA